MGLRVDNIRADFALLQQKNPPIYFDSACMSLRPKQVVQAIAEYYNEYPACAGRSVHSLSRKVDEKIFEARKAITKSISAKKDEEVIFLRNTTEAINLVARSFDFTRRDVILTGSKEHNSNLLPWQLVAKRKKLVHKTIPFAKDNSFSMEYFEEMLSKHSPKLISLGHTSNLDGASIPAKKIIKKAHNAGAKVMLDAAQSVPHKNVDVANLDVDFLAFSGHKMMGPSGTGILYGKKKLLEELEHDTVGGETVHDTTYDEAKWAELPHKFEAGLQNYAGIIGLGSAVSYLAKIGKDKIAKHEVKLNKIITDGLLIDDDFTLIGPEDPSLRGGIVSFMHKKMSAHDVASLLNATKNIMIRSGRHCVHSWFNDKKISSSARASFYAYSTEEEAQTFVDEVGKIVKLGK